MTSRLHTVSETSIRANTTETSKTLTFAGCWVLVGFSKTMPRCRWDMQWDVGQQPVTGQCADVNLCHCVSSACCRLSPWQLTTRASSTLYRTYNSWSSTDLGGTPNSTDCTEDSWQLWAICCILLVTWPHPVKDWVKSLNLANQIQILVTSLAGEKTNIHKTYK